MRPKARLFLVVSLVLVTWLISGSLALAKGPVDKINLTAPGLANPIEITDPSSLAQFNPWTREFIDWSRGLVTEPPTGEEAYEVSFYLKPGERASCAKLEGEFCLIYVLQYSPDPLGGPGYLYLPGPGEPWYRVNIGTIITASSDAWDPNGKWHHATDQWDMLMQRGLSADDGSGSASASPDAGAVSTPNPWVLALAAMGLLTGGASLLWLRLRRRPV